MSVYFVEWTWF